MESTRQRPPATQPAESTERSEPAQLAVPEDLGSKVAWNGDTLVLHDSGFQPPGLQILTLIGSAFAFLFGLALTVALVGLGLGMAEISSTVAAVAILLSVLPIGLGSVGAITMVGVGSVVAKQEVPLEISLGEAHIRHRLGNRIREVRAVRIEGTVGRSIVVKIVGATEIVAFRKKPALENGWTYDAIRWFAQAAADTVGVPLDDALDDGGWRRWVDDPNVRKKVSFDLMIERNRRTFGRFHRAESVEPRYVTYDHHELRVGTIRIDADHVHYKGSRIPLHAIRDAQPFFGTLVQDDLMDPTHQAAVKVFTDDRTYTLSRRPVRENRMIGETHWLAAKLRELAATAKPPSDGGTDDDVPDALQDLRATDASPEPPPESSGTRPPSTDP